MLKISNDSGHDIATDKYFVLEHFENEEWNVVEFKENVFFTEEGIIIKHGSVYAQRIDIEQSFSNLSKGLYRISKQVGAANQGIVRAEFLV